LIPSFRALPKILKVGLELAAGLECPLLAQSGHGIALQNVRCEAPHG
jgi:hypothetical protein